MNFDRKIKVVWGSAFSIFSMAGVIYTMLTNGNPALYPVFVAFATIGGTLIHGKSISSSKG